MATTITHTLPGFPHVWQLHEATADGLPDENASWNCVPASLAAGLMYLTGRTFDGDALHDAVYGQGYRGAQAAAAYVDYCARQGVRLSASRGDPQALVARAHAALAAGHPVVATIPSRWGIARDAQPAGYTTHVVAFCGWGDGPGALRAMNPWLQPPAWHDGDDSYWAERLCMGEVWTMEKIGTEEAPTHMANTQGLGPGLAALAQQIGSDAASAETPLNGQGDTYARLANGAVIWWDHAAQAGHADNPAHVVAGLEATIAGLKAQLAAAKAQPAPAPTPNPGVLLDLPTLTAKAQMWDAAALVFGKLVGK